MKKTPWLVRICLIAFGIALALGASEIALRILARVRSQAGSEFKDIAELRRSILTGGTFSQEKAGTSSGGERTMNLGGIVSPHPSDEIIYDLRPQLDVRFQGVSVTTNSCGLRGPEASIVKPSGTYRIAMMGDSFAFGWGVDQERAFPQVLEDTLNHKSLGRPRFEVLNFGVPGYSTFQEVARFKADGLDYDPDAVIVYFVENDFGLPFYIRDIEDQGKLLASLDLARLARNALGTPKEDKFKMTGYDPSRALIDLATVAEARGIKVFLAINPKKAWGGIRGRLWALKQRRDIVVMDLHDDLVRVIKDEGIEVETLQLPTDPHPSAIKHGILGRIMAPYFLPVIEAAAR